MLCPYLLTTQELRSARCPCYNPPMRICYTLTSYPPAIGGAQLCFHALARALSPAHEVQVVAQWRDNRTDWLLRPRVTWNFERNWRLAIGADIFDGPPLGMFGQYDNRDRLYSEVRYSF